VPQGSSPAPFYPSAEEADTIVAEALLFLVIKHVVPLW